MKLSDYQLEKFGIELIKDGKFDILGSITKDYENKLVFINENKYIDLLLKNINSITSVICKKEHLEFIPNNIGIGISDNPQLSFYLFHNYIANNYPAYHFLPESRISKNASIHPTAYIDKNVTISDGCVIQPHVIILRGTILEENVIIGPGCVIGGEGFRFIKEGSQIIPVHHVGGVVLKENVELQSNTCIDKAVYKDYTLIDANTKIDNLVHVAHGVKIGKRCLIAASAMIGGSVIVGDDVWIGPNASISDNLRIGNRARVSIGAVVTKDVPEETTVSGNFAIEHKKFIDFIKKIR